MDEKIIIKSELYNFKNVRNRIWIFGGIIATLISLFVMDNIAGVTKAEYMFASQSLRDAWGGYGIGYTLKTYGVQCVLIGFIFSLVIGAILYALISKMELVVTDKRVYGTALFGKRVDLPFDMIAAVGTSLFKGIAVTSASGAIKFLMIKNRDAIHSAISKLLINRQGKPTATTTIKQEIPQSNAEELKKYKELFDNGVITQDEFDAKKKQLLGL